MKKLLLLFAVILFLSACGEETANIDGEALKYEQIKEKIESKESELKEAEGKVNDAKNELTDIKNSIIGKKAQYEGLEELASNKDKMESDLKNAEDKLNDINTQIVSAEDKLNKLNGEIVKTSDQPIKIGAGYFYFGEDVEAGRYKLTAQEGQRGNVFIRRDGRSYVGETFGDGSRGTLTEFIFTSLPGDEIEATIPIYLYPTE